MILSISPKNIEAWEMNPRKRIDTKRLQPLVDSMLAVGWFGAIMVRPLPAHGIYQVLAGERRWRAALAVGLDCISCEVREMDDKEAIELAVIENRDREDLDVIEEAGAYKVMVELGWTVAEIASRSGKSADSIYRLLDLCDLDAAVQEALRDHTITGNTARLLGRIEDDGDRAEALLRVVKPRVQDLPLSEKQALPLIQREYLDPQKRQKEWAKREKALRKEHGKEVDIFSVRDAGKVTGFASGYVRCDERPQKYDLAVNWRDREDVPTWGDLADRHGARRAVVPDANGNAVFYVLSEPLVTAETVAGEKNPDECLFPLRGAGRHEQSLDRDKHEAADAAECKKVLEKNLEEQKRLVRLLYEGLATDGAPVLLGTLARVLAVLKVLVERGAFDGMVEPVAQLLGHDLEALGEGVVETGERLWLMRLCDERGLDAAVFLMAGYGVANEWPDSNGATEFFEAIAKAMSDENEKKTKGKKVR